MSNNRYHKELGEIRKLHNEYGDVVFAMSMTHLIDVGIRSMTPESTQKAIDKINAQCGDKQNNIISENLQIAILEIAESLSKYSPITLLLYAKLYMHIDGDNYLEMEDAKSAAQMWLENRKPEQCGNLDLIEQMAHTLISDPKEYSSGELVSAYNSAVCSLFDTGSDSHGQTGE